MKFQIPSCHFHGMPTCRGSSGSFVNTGASMVHPLYTHCGADFEREDINRYTNLSLVNPEQEESGAKLKDVLSVKRVYFVSGKHLPIYSGPEQ